MWKKITKQVGRKNIGGSELRKTPATFRPKKGGAHLVLPAGATDAIAADVFSDGNGKLAYVFADKGEYKLRKAGPKSKARIVTIPNSFAKRIPYGTTDVTLYTEAGMTILDLSQFEKAAS